MHCKSTTAACIVYIYLCAVLQPTFDMTITSPSPDKTPVSYYHRGNISANSHQSDMQECLNYTGSGNQQ